MHLPRLLDVNFCRLCSFHLPYTSPLLLHAHVPVEPAVRYRFRLASNETAATTPWRNLNPSRLQPQLWKGLPKRGDELKVAVIGDLGQTAFSEATCRDVAKVQRSEGLDLGVARGEIFQETEASKSRAVRGRQVLYLFDQYFKTNEEAKLEQVLPVAPYVGSQGYNWRKVPPEGPGGMWVGKMIFYFQALPKVMFDNTVEMIAIEPDGKQRKHAYLPRVFNKTFPTTEDCPRADSKDLKRSILWAKQFSNMIECSLQEMKAKCEFECDEEGFVCEHCERLIRPACAGLVPGLEFLADTGSEEDLISKSDCRAHFPDVPIGPSTRPVSLITANGPVKGNQSVKLEADIERYQAKLKREAAARAEEERDAARAMPTQQCINEPHRVKMATLYWEKLGELSELQYALVARVVNRAEIDRTPKAKEAMDKEWQKLVDKSCWLHSKVREFRDVSAEAVRKGIKAHLGRIFQICSIEGDELPEGHPDRKWKGRSVFQGNRVSDEHNDHAIFSELGSSPALMEAAKVIDVFGSQPGGIWEKHCEEQLKTVGWTPVLPEIWQSIFYHAELDLLLVIYVDDFKMAGPSQNLDKGWETIESVIDMDPPEPFGRYFGCNHVEKTQVKLPRSAHPFAYVFDKRTAVPARGDPRTQVDYWEVDTELGAVVRHHVYPRTRLINHNLCNDVAQKGGKDSDSRLVAKPTIAAASHGRPSLERIAQDLLMVKDFSYQGLLSVAAEFPTKVSMQRRSRLTTTDNSYYRNWGFFSFSGMQGVTNITKRFPNACRYMNEWISKHARKGFTWTSIAVNRDAKSLLHASENFAVSFGDFDGGLLWIEGTNGQGPATQTKANGTVATCLLAQETHLSLEQEAKAKATLLSEGLHSFWAGATPANHRKGGLVVATPWQAHPRLVQSLWAGATPANHRKGGLVVATPWQAHPRLVQSLCVEGCGFLAIELPRVQWRLVIVSVYLQSSTGLQAEPNITIIAALLALLQRVRLSVDKVVPFAPHFCLMLEIDLAHGLLNLPSLKGFAGLQGALSIGLRAGLPLATAHDVQQPVPWALLQLVLQFAREEKGGGSLPDWAAALGFESLQLPPQQPTITNAQREQLSGREEKGGGSLPDWAAALGFESLQLPPQQPTITNAQREQLSGSISQELSLCRLQVSQRSREEYQQWLSSSSASSLKPLFKSLRKYEASVERPFPSFSAASKLLLRLQQWSALWCSSGTAPAPCFEELRQRACAQARELPALGGARVARPLGRMAGLRSLREPLAMSSATSWLTL
eukprot:s4042_g1.t1